MISCWLQPALQADLEAEYQQKLAQTPTDAGTMERISSPEE